MFYALLLAAASPMLEPRELVGGLPVPYVEMLCNAGQDAANKGERGFWNRTLRDLPSSSELEVRRYCTIYARGKLAGMRRVELPESTN